jgi:UDP-glucose 4-epimerase
MKVLVTGGAGFLGGHVASGLRDAGHEVVVHDVVVSAGPYLRGVHVIEGNLLDRKSLVSACRGIDGICHLGGVGDVILAGKDPGLAAESNVVGTANVVEAAREAGVSRIVYASTWEVYGDPRYQPLDEDHPCAPDHPYNITKFAGECLALAADRLGGVPTVALRLGTAYGLRMRPNAVFSRFIRAASRREPIVIQGTGLQSRQFTHTRDVARGFKLAIESDLRGTAINLVAAEPVTIRTLAEMVAARFPTEIRFTEARAGDIHPSAVDSSRAARLLGWRAEVPFGVGLAEMMDEVGSGA